MPYDSDKQNNKNPDEYDQIKEQFDKVLKNVPEKIDSSDSTGNNTLLEIFDFKENNVNSGLAYLLDPKSVGSVEPLNALIKAADITKPVFSEGDMIEVTREKKLGDYRRIDISINSDSLIIGIEVKIFQYLYSDQLDVYSSKLKDRASEEGKELLLIFLYSENLRGYVQSRVLTEIKETCGFIPVSFKRLAEAFENISGGITDEVATFIINDFIAWKGEMNSKNKIGLSQIDWNFLKYSHDFSEEIYSLKNRAEENNKKFRDYFLQKMNEYFAKDCEIQKENTNRYYLRLKKRTMHDIRIDTKTDSPILPYKGLNANYLTDDHIENFYIEINYSDIESFENSITEFLEEMKKRISNSQKSC